MKIIGKVMQGCIRAYQLFLAPIFGTGCRFQPSCSSYAMDAIECHGPLKGAWLGFWRILVNHILLEDGLLQHLFLRHLVVFDHHGNV